MNRKPEQPHADQAFNRRLLLVVAGFALFLGAIVAMLLNIQVVNVSKYRQKASRQYERVVTEKASRGIILDRHGRMLAESIESVSFYADPKVVRNTLLFNEKGRPVMDSRSRKQKSYDNSGNVASLFARHLGRSRQELLQSLRRRKGVAVLGRRIPIAKALPLMQEKIPGVWFDREHQRYYLNVAAQLIGVTNSRNEGASGLELQLDKELRGVDGTRIYQRTATGRRFPAPDARQEEPLRGATVELTIDADLQSIVEDELAAAVEAFDAAAATSIVMEIRTGEILAMANSPTFNLNRRVDWTPEKARNRAVTDSYEPGSTFKLVMAAAATEELGRRAEDTVFAWNGEMPIYNLRIRDHEKLGDITFREAIMHSSNIVAANTATELGRQRFHDYAHHFGFGHKSGIGLVGESPGKVRPLDEWDTTTLPWMGFGYQVMTTPLQVLQAYAAIANDGVLMRPYVVKRVLDGEGRTLRRTKPEKIRRVVSRETARYIGFEYFKAVVDSGTAVAAQVPGLEIAGKTGTARRAAGGSYAKPAYVSSFAGYFPVEEPHYAVIVLVEAPKTAYYASTVAAPVFSRIASRMIACSGEMQKNLAMRSPRQEQLAALRSIAVPDLSGLSGRQARSLLQWVGLGMDYSGDLDDRVVGQDLPAGSMVEERGKVRVRLAADTTNRDSS